MLQVFLCDDNEVLLSKYKSSLVALAKKHALPVCFSAFTSGEQLLFALSQDPDAAAIVYLDILMGGISGIEVARQIRALGSHSEIIFLTSSEEFVFESFDSSPLHYIVKGSPEEEERMEQVFVKAVALATAKANDVFLCENAGVKKKIPLYKISYFEIRGRVVTVHFDGGTFDFYSGIDSVEAGLAGKSFIRCHRSFLVNLRYIDSIYKGSLLLTTGEEIPMGSTYAKDVKMAFSSSLSCSF